MNIKNYDEWLEDRIELMQETDETYHDFDEEGNVVEIDYDGEVRPTDYRVSEWSER